MKSLRDSSRGKKNKLEEVHSSVLPWSGLLLLVWIASYSVLEPCRDSTQYPRPDFRDLYIMNLRMYTICHKMSYIIYFLYCRLHRIYHILFIVDYILYMLYIMYYILCIVHYILSYIHMHIYVYICIYTYICLYTYRYSISYL